MTNRKNREPSRSAIMSCARREAGPSEPAGTGTRAPSPRRRNLFSFLGALFLFAGAPAAAQGSVAMDRAALVALYDATGGSTWTINTNWSTAADLSEWHGVNTDATGRVTEVSLSQNMLSGEIPAELGGMTSLQLLSLWGNELSGEIPVELAGPTS